MNCKPGDLVVIVNVRLVGKLNCRHIGRIVVAEAKGPDGMWSTEPLCDDLEIPGNWITFSDDELRPIRDQPGEDETLQWAPIPRQEVTA